MKEFCVNGFFSLIGIVKGFSRRVFPMFCAKVLFKGVVQGVVQGVCECFYESVFKRVFKKVFLLEFLLCFFKGCHD